jgi:hypothetical protein
MESLDEAFEGVRLAIRGTGRALSTAEDGWLKQEERATNLGTAGLIITALTPHGAAPRGPGGRGTGL